MCLFKNTGSSKLCVHVWTCVCAQIYMHILVCIVKLQNETRKYEIMASQSFLHTSIPPGSFGVLQNCVMC